METETLRVTKTGIKIFLRPVKESDHRLIDRFLRSLSEETLLRRFLSLRKKMLEEFLVKLLETKAASESKILVIGNRDQDEVLGVGQFCVCSGSFAEIALVIKDDYQNKGIGRELLGYLAELARNEGLDGFEALIQMDNRPMLHLCETIGLRAVEKTIKLGIYEVRMYFHKQKIYV